MHLINNHMTEVGGVSQEQWEVCLQRRLSEGFTEEVSQGLGSVLVIFLVIKHLTKAISW